MLKGPTMLNCALILLLVGLASACSAKSPATDDSGAMKDALTGTKSPTVAVPTATIPTATDTPVVTETNTPTTIPSLTPVPLLISVGPDNFPADVDPLTGLQVQDPSILERRPVAVKVQIFPRGDRPPMGVSLADIVFDFYQNAGMTRFHAIFYSQDAAQVGPIRSGRLLDKHLVQMYGSFLAFGSADQRILNRYYGSDMSGRLIFEWQGKCPPMCRIDPNGSNFLVTDTAGLSTYATESGKDNTRQNLDGMTFHSTAPAGGVPANQINVRFSIGSYTRWDYDPASGRYLRFQDIQEAASVENEAYAAMVDKMTDEQLTADNVVVLLVPHKYAFNSRPGNNEIIDIVLEGNGSAYAFRDGMMYEVQWHRPEQNSVLNLTLPDGSAYAFKPGNTWFEIVGQSSKLSSSTDGPAYRFEHSTP